LGLQNPKGTTNKPTQNTAFYKQGHFANPKSLSFPSQSHSGKRSSSAAMVRIFFHHRSISRCGI